MKTLKSIEIAATADGKIGMIFTYEGEQPAQTFVLSLERCREFMDALDRGYLMARSATEQPYGGFKDGLGVQEDVHMEIRSDEDTEVS